MNSRVVKLVSLILVFLNVSTILHYAPGVFNFTNGSSQYPLATFAIIVNALCGVIVSALWVSEE